jgi:hypothetical protein
MAKDDDKKDDIKVAVQAKPALVKMIRAQPAHPGGPVTADVHADEVKSYEGGGWHKAGT